MLTRDELQFALIESVPLHKLLGMRLSDDGHEPPAVVLPDRPDLRNHLGGTAGAALFAVAEAASAAMVFTSYARLLAQAFAVPSGARVDFRRPANGELLARAGAGPSEEDLDAMIEAEGQAELEVPVEVFDSEQTVVLAQAVVWQFRARRPGSPPALPRAR